MNTPIKHIRSSTSGNVPVYTILEYGELALNYADGALFYRNSSDEVIPVASVNNNLVTGEYLFDTGTTATDPGSGLVRLNNGTRSSVTAIHIDKLSNLKTDLDTILKSVLAGDVIVWQDKATAANTVRYRVTSAPTNNTGWWSIPVEWMSETGSLWTASTLLSFTLHRIGTIGTNGLVNGAVTLAKMDNMATASLIYRKTAGSGAPEVNTLATLKTDLGLTGTNSGDQTITLTGDVTGSGTNSFAATIANDAVSFAKMQNSAAAGLSVVGRSTNSAGDFAEIEAASDGHILRRSGTSVGFGTVLPAAVVGASTSKAARFDGSGILVADGHDIPDYPVGGGYGSTQWIGGPPSGDWSGPTGTGWVDLYDTDNNSVTLGVGHHEVIMNFVMNRTAGASAAQLEYRWDGTSANISQFFMVWETYTNLTSSSATSGFTLDSSGWGRSVAMPGGVGISTSIGDASMIYKVYIRQLVNVNTASTFTPQIRFSGAISATTTMQWGSYWTHRSFSSQGGIA